MTTSTATLNEIIAIAKDGYVFYMEAAEKVDDADLKSIFANTAQVKADIIAALSSEVRSEGDTPAISRTLVGEANRFFAEICAMLGDTDYAYVAQLEESEDRLLGHFKDAMANEEISDSALAALNRLMPEVRKCHDMMRDRKHAMQGDV